MSTSLGITIFIAALATGAWLLKKTGQRDLRNERNFLARYEIVKEIIQTHEVCEQNFNFILYLLDGLCAMKWKDHRRTNELKNLFHDKYSEYLEKEDAQTLK